MPLSRFAFPVLLTISLAPAQSPIEQTVDQLFRTKELKETALSPDGRRVAWVQPGPKEDDQQIWLHEGEGAAPPTRLTAGKSATDEHGLAWSPDGMRIAFFSDVERKGQSQLFVAPMKGKPRRVTTEALKGALAKPQWSPDGKRLAFLYTKDAPRSQGALEPTAAPSGEIDSAIFYQRIAVVDLASGELKKVSPADQYVYEFHWSPDGGKFAYISAPGPGENNWWIAKLYTIDVKTDAVKELVKPEWQITMPRWSPDGKQIAFISGLMSDEGLTGGDLFVVLSDATTAPRNLTPGRKGSPSWLAWLPSGQRISLQ